MPFGRYNRRKAPSGNDLAMMWMSRKARGALRPLGSHRRSAGGDRGPRATHLERARRLEAVDEEARHDRVEPRAAAVRRAARAVQREEVA